MSLVIANPSPLLKETLGNITTVKGFQISDDGPQLRLLPDNNILRSNLPVGEKKKQYSAQQPDQGHITMRGRQQPEIYKYKDKNART